MNAQKQSKPRADWSMTFKSKSISGKIASPIKYAAALPPTVRDSMRLFRSLSRDSPPATQTCRADRANGGASAQAAESAPTTRKCFKFYMVVGKGGFGKVWLVASRAERKYFALKEMSKLKIVAKKSVHSVMNEKHILSLVEHPFIVNMKCSFQDQRHLYLVMDLVTGGDLRFHVCCARSFTEQQTRFFTACMLLALEYVHGRGFLHRDIKPENLVFDEKGYLRLTDFGIARQWNPDNGKETSGTPGYMAPEVMCRLPHGFEADYYAVGVICYECIMGRRPYDGKSRAEIRDQVLKKQRALRPEEVGEGWSAEAVDFVNRLIQRKPHQRLGSRGIAEVMAHPWFGGFDWARLRSKEMPPPFVPNVKEVFEYLRTLSEESTLQTEANQSACFPQSVTQLFEDYDCARRAGGAKVPGQRPKEENPRHALKTKSKSSWALHPPQCSQSPRRAARAGKENYLSINIQNASKTSANFRKNLLSSRDSSSGFIKLRSSFANGPSVCKPAQEEGNTLRFLHLPKHDRAKAVSGNIPRSLHRSYQATKIK